MSSQKHLNHGPYSTKMMFPKAMDMTIVKEKGEDKPHGVPLGFITHPDPFAGPPLKSTREQAMFKGPQIMLKVERTEGATGGYLGRKDYFGKLTYEPEPFYDGKKILKENEEEPEPKPFMADADGDGSKRTASFGSSKPAGREDLCSTLHIGRYRHQLSLEKKALDKNGDDLEAAAATLGASGGGGSLSGSGRMGKTGLMSTIPQFTSQFDRQRHVEEFSTRRYAPEVKFTREHGSMRPASSEIGEGCAEVDRLVAPSRGIKKPNTHSIAHMAVTSLNASLH